MTNTKSSFEFTVRDFIETILNNHAVAEVVKSRKSAMEHEIVITSKEDWNKCMDILDVYPDHWNEYKFYENWYIMDSDGSITLESGEGRKLFPMWMSHFTYVYRTNDGATLMFVPDTKKLYISFIWKECAKGFKISL